MAMARPDTPESHGDERVPNLDSSAEERDWSNLGETNVIDPAAKASTPLLGSPIPLDQANPGMVLGDFRLLEKLGEGAMGAVYRAEQISFDRVVALKLLFSRIAKQPNLVERLYREGRVLGQLDHPNIVQAYAIDELNGSHYVAMEYIDGDNLQRWIRKLGRLSVEDAVLITMKIAEALEYAHNQGVIHRDLKPENVLITKKGVVKIADFGMVKVSDEEMDLTQTGHALGTPWYMPLEQARNAKDIDGRSDIYALGCVLYCMLTGSPPFAGRTFVEVLQAKELGTFPPARSVNVHVPERLDLVLLKMVQKQPKHRYATGGEAVRDLESLGLAASRPSFLNQMPKTGLQTGAGALPTTSKTLADSGVPSIDPHVWYLRMSGAVGKFSTEQVLAMAESGKVNMTTMASHLAKSDYRALSTYKEFTGPLAKAARGADRSPSRYEEIYRQAEERDKVREETLATHRDRGEWRDVALYYAGYIAAGVAVLLVFFWFMSKFWSSPGTRLCESPWVRGVLTRGDSCKTRPPAWRRSSASLLPVRARYRSFIDCKIELVATTVFRPLGRSKPAVVRLLPELGETRLEIGVRSKIDDLASHRRSEALVDGFEHAIERCGGDHKESIPADHPLAPTFFRSARESLYVVEYASTFGSGSRRQFRHACA